MFGAPHPPEQCLARPSSVWSDCPNQNQKQFWALQMEKENSLGKTTRHCLWKLKGISTVVPTQTQTAVVRTWTWVWEANVLGSIYTKRQQQCCKNSAMMLVILLLLKTMESLKIGVASHFANIASVIETLSQNWCWRLVQMDRYHRNKWLNYNRLPSHVYNAVEPESEGSNIFPHTSSKQECIMSKLIEKFYHPWRCKVVPFCLLISGMLFQTSNFLLFRFTRRSRSTVTMATLPDMRTAAPSSRVELRIRCKDLINKDVTSKSDPCAVIYMQEGGRWYEVGIYVVLCTRKILKNRSSGINT